MKRYLIDLAERSLMTGVQTLGAYALASQPFSVLTFQWTEALTLAASAAALSVLKGLAARPTGPTDGAGLGT